MKNPAKLTTRISGVPVRRVSSKVSTSKIGSTTRRGEIMAHGLADAAQLLATRRLVAFHEAPESAATRAAAAAVACAIGPESSSESGWPMSTGWPLHAPSVDVKLPPGIATDTNWFVKMPKLGVSLV